MKPSSAKKLPKWLRQLQKGSWYPEIVISLGAIYSLLALSDGLIHLGNTIKFSAAFPGLDELFLLAMISIKGITIGFIFHIFLRGVWIALLCLNYAYPEGINFERLKLTGVYLDHAGNFKLNNQIKALDTTCGLIYFGSFLFIIIAVGFITPYFATLPLYWLANRLSLIDDPSTIFYVISSIIVLFYLEMLFGSPLRKNKIIGKIYYPIYTALNFITLAFIYRPWVQILFSNIGKLKVFFFSITFLSATILYANVALVDLLYWRTVLEQYTYAAAPVGGKRANSFYEDQLQEGEFVHFASIPTDVINSGFLRVFVPYRNAYTDDIKTQEKQFFSELVSLTIDSVKTDSVVWIAQRHQKTNQLGIVARVPIQHLASGQHELHIQIKGTSYPRGNKIRLFFWKE